MMPFLTETQRIEILIMIGYGDRVRTHQEVCQLFRDKYPDNPISQSTVSKIEKKFRDHGTVKNLPKTGRPVTVLTEDVQLDILLEIEDNPHSTSRNIALDYNLSHTSVLKLLKMEKFHPYKVTLVHELSETDFDLRQEFCERMTDICNRDPMFVQRLIFSDEATFSLRGHVNRQNCRYWSRVNPHWMNEAHTQYPEKVNVWAGIVGNRILGPFFFNDNLSGEMYLEFLQFELVPALAVLFPNGNDPDVPNENIWFQQDGAPPHYARNVRRYLDEVFPGRWLGRRGPIEWPARSPDLTPLDFFLWGHLKSRVYQNRPNNLDDLKARIRHECNLVTPQTIQNVLTAFYDRLGYCQMVQGHQFEHFV